MPPQGLILYVAFGCDNQVHFLIPLKHVENIFAEKKQMLFSVSLNTVNHGSQSKNVINGDVVDLMIHMIIITLS